MSRVVAALACALVGLLCAAASGCGGGRGDVLDRTLGYLPAASPAVVAVSTDFNDPQWGTFEARLATPLLGNTVENLLAEELRAQGVSFDDDVRPLLGHDLAVGIVRGPPGGVGVVAALQIRDADSARSILDRLRVLRRAGRLHGAALYRSRRGTVSLALDGDMLVAASTAADLRAALARRHATGRLGQRAFSRALGALPDDGFLRGYGSASTLIASSPLRRAPWFSAVRSYGLTASFESRRLIVRAALNTDRSRVRAGELPVRPGVHTPALSAPGNDVVGASADQSATLRFVARTVTAAFPRSRVARELRAAAGALLELSSALSGPGLTALGPGGDLAARAAVRDPMSLGGALRRLRPRLGGLSAAVAASRTASRLAPLLSLLAPTVALAAPPGARAGGRAVPVRNTRDLYRVPRTGARDLYFGLVDGVFVAATDLGAARRLGQLPTAVLVDVHGAAVARADLRALSGPLGPGLGGLTLPFGEAVASVIATRSATRATLDVRLR